MAIFVIHIEKTRFQIRPLSGGQMRLIAQDLTNSILRRIKSGQNIKDAAAVSLTEAYLRRKTRRGLSNIRDWFWTGRTLNYMRVLRASPNKAVIGFASQLADVVAGAQNKREKMFGVSRHDRIALYQAVERELKRTDIVQLRRI